MASNTEDLQDKIVSSPSVSDVVGGSPAIAEEVDDATYQAMLDILDELTDHTHIFFDNYTTACNCNCNCNCTRGIV